MTPENYIVQNNLFDKETLLAHCEKNLVHVIESPRYPNLVMLHYKEEAHFDQLWTPFNRMCRGLILDLVAKRVVAYPFNKFFNLGEQPETSLEEISKLGAFEVSEKMDGSMLILFQDPTSKEFRVTTKGSFDSEHGIYATQFIPSVLKSETLNHEYTFVFELIDSKFRIVVDYDKKGYEEGIYLIGMRHRPSNRLLSYKEVQLFAQIYGLKTLKTYEFSSLDTLLETVKTLPVLEEGFVLRFSNDLLVKVKGPAYLAAHKFISKLSPKYILESLGAGTTDELLQIAPEEYRQDVQDAIASFISERQVIDEDCLEYFEKAPKATRKEFALWVKSEVPEYYQGFLFTLMDKKPLDKKKVYALVGERSGVSGETRI